MTKQDLDVYALILEHPSETILKIFPVTKSSMAINTLNFSHTYSTKY